MLLEVRNLDVFYKNAHIIKNVSFDTNTNEIFSIIGESGSGKSTLAKAIVGLIPYKGHIKYNGKDIFMIFQDPGNYLDPLFKVYTQIGIIRKALIKEKDINSKDIIEKAIKMVKLNVEDMKTKYPHQLSGGEQQRVMIAMSLARSSELVIADEPTSSLDILVQKEILCTFKNMKKYFTTILITHDIDVVKQVADRVLVLKDGIVQEISDKDSFFKNPKSDYGKRLLENYL